MLRDVLQVQQHVVADDSLAGFHRLVERSAQVDAQARVRDIEDVTAWGADRRLQIAPGRPGEAQNLTRRVHERTGRRVLLEHQALEAGANHLIRDQRGLHDTRRRGVYNGDLRVRELHRCEPHRLETLINLALLVDDLEEFGWSW